MRWLKLAFLFLSVPLFGQQLGFALEQVNGQAILDEGLTGKGVKIGIIDGGFLGADKAEALQQYFDVERKQTVSYRDYLDEGAPPFSGIANLDDAHGTLVWQLIGGYNHRTKVQHGLATGAIYYLARTDHGGYEKRKEEELAIRALEWMAGEGVQIINISLGYNFGYTDRRENYLPEQMDGKTTIMTRAVNRIAKEHNILIVVAAGNDGDNKWRIVGTPADAKEAMTVGATKFKVWDDMKYSSKGPEWLDYVKPDVSCYASGGTSFSAPIITGLAACLLEKNPTLTYAELKKILLRSTNLAAPNNYLGHGVPDAQKALDILNGKNPPTPQKVTATKKVYRLTLAHPSIYVTAYHKSGWKVLKKETIRTSKTTLKIKRKEEAESTTLLWEHGSLEITWKQ